MEPLQVITVSDGRQGLQKAIGEKPDIILLDTNMLVMNGHELLERMRKHPLLKDISVIIVRALCKKRDIITASTFGIVDYVTKPVDFTNLLEKMSSILAGEISNPAKKQIE